MKAGYYCRICKTSSNDAQNQTTECKHLLKTPEIYLEDVKVNDYHKTGIREECAFNKVIQILNNRIQNFDYGLTETSNKPPIIGFKANSNKLNCKMSASEMLRLVRYLGLMIGDLIPEDDQHWQLYLYLRQIIDIVTSPRLISSDIKVLNNSITLHNQLYIKFFGALKPKFHNLVHYPTVLENNGPRILYWPMRYESRHRQLKENAHSSKCNINLLVTIATKQLLQLAQLFNS